VAQVMRGMPFIFRSAFCSRHSSFSSAVVHRLFIKVILQVLQPGLDGLLLGVDPVELVLGTLPGQSDEVEIDADMLRELSDCFLFSFGHHEMSSLALAIQFLAALVDPFRLAIPPNERRPFFRVMLEGRM
jgi:hypothetical protein